MRFQIWHGIADNDRNKGYGDCKNDIKEGDLAYEMKLAMIKARESASRDVEDGGSHYRPFVEIIMEKEPNFKPNQGDE